MAVEMLIIKFIMHFGSRAQKTCCRIGYEVYGKRRNQGKQFGREYPKFSFKHTRFAKSINHPGEDVEKLYQIRGNVLEKIYRGGFRDYPEKKRSQIRPQR